MNQQQLQLTLKLRQDLPHSNTSTINTILLVPAITNVYRLTAGTNAPYISISPIKPINADQLRTIISAKGPSKEVPKFDIVRDCGEIKTKNIVLVSIPESSITHLNFFRNMSQLVIQFQLEQTFLRLEFQGLKLSNERFFYKIF